MFLHYIFIFITLSLHSLYAQNITVAVESRFVPFIKKVERNKSSLKFNIQKKNTSFDAFQAIKKKKVLLAIVRGDILIDYNNNSNQIRIISKLKSPTFLYLVSKNGINNAYELLNSDEKKEGVKCISVGYLNDLSNIYLKDIAKNVYSQYSFHYKYFPPKESFKKLKENKIDSAYLFLSPFFVKKAKKMGFKLQKIIKAKNKTILSKKLEEQKAFTVKSNGIRVDNYLITSSTISKKSLKALLFSLKKQGVVLSKTSSQFGKIDSRTITLSKKIDTERKIAKALVLKQEKECKDAKSKRLKLLNKKKKFKIAKKYIYKKMKAITLSLNSKSMGDLKLLLGNIRLSVKHLDKDFFKIVKKLESKKLQCNPYKTDKYMKLLNLKISKLNSNKNKLKNIKKKILKIKALKRKKRKQVPIIKIKPPKVIKEVTIKEVIIKEKIPVIEFEPLPIKKEEVIIRKKPSLSLEREDREYEEFQ
jgi:hypothetical protein